MITVTSFALFINFFSLVIDITVSKKCSHRLIMKKSGSWPVEISCLKRLKENNQILTTNRKTEEQSEVTKWEELICPDRKFIYITFYKCGEQKSISKCLETTYLKSCKETTDCPCAEWMTLFHLCVIEKYKK